MAVVQFVCPHCSGRFELASPTPGGQAACPRCGRSLAIPAELPAAADGAADDAAAFVPRSPEPDSPAPELAFDPGELSGWLPARREAGPAATPVERPVVHLTREEKEHRRQRRNLIWMIGGVILLAIATIVLSRL
jgi:hypothetical protein